MQKVGIHIKFSKMYLLGICVICLCAFSSIYFLTLDGMIKILLLLLVILYGFYCVRSMYTFRTIQPLGENRWVLTTKKRSYMGYVCHDSTVTSHICILRFKLLDHRFKKTCIILRDSVEKDRYRALLVELYACRKIA